MIRRSLRFLLRLTAGLALATLVVIGLAVWRVASGPVSLTFLTPTLAGALDAALDAAGHLHTEVADTVLSWGGFHHPLELRLREVKVEAADGRIIARIPQLAVGLSVRKLAQGRLALSRLAVIGPTLHLERTAGGRLMLDIDGGATPAAPAPLEVADGGGPLPALLATLRRSGADTGPLASLTQLSVVDAALTLEDKVAGVTWSVPRASLNARRGAGGLQAQARIELPVPGHPGVLEATASERKGDGALVTTLTLRDVDVAALVPALPALAPLAGSRLPLSGSLETIFDRDLKPVNLRLAVADAGPGDLTGPLPLTLSGLSLAGGADLAAGRFSLDQARLTLGDPAVTLTAAGGGGARGGEIRVALGTDAGSPRLTLRLAPRDGGADLTLALAGLAPSTLAALSPALAPLAAAAIPLSGTLSLALDPAWTPGRLALELALAPGRIVLPPDQLAEPVPVRSGAVRLALIPAAGHPFAAPPERLEIETATVDLDGPVLSASGTVAREGDRLTLRGGIRARAVPADSLSKLWPYKVGYKPREWIVQRISAGTIDEAWINVDAGAPLADPTDIIATALDGGIAASNLTVAYFKTLPPLVGVSGHGTTDGRDLVVTTSGGRVLDMPAAPSRLVFTKLDTKQEWLDIDALLSGSIRSALEVLDTAPLGYAHKVGIDPTRTRGSQTAHLHFYFPLKKSLDIDAVAIHADAVLHGAATENVAGGINVSEGDLKLDLDNAGMDVVGRARLDGLPATLTWRENFSDAADPQTRVILKGDLDEKVVTTRFPFLKDRVGGTLATAATVVVDKRHKTTLSGRLDLTRARLALPELNWRKTEDGPGSLRFSAGFEKGRPAHPFQLGLDSPNLTVSGGGVYDGGTGALSRLTLGEVKGGANDFHLEVKTRPDRSLEIALAGASVDARPLLARGDGDKKRPPAKDKAPGPRYDLSLQAARVVTGGEGRAFTGVHGRFVNDGTGWDSLELSARTAGAPAGLILRYVPEGDGRRLTITSEDAGAVLRTLDLTDSVRGGALSLTGGGAPGIPAHPVTAKLELGEFRVVGAPLLARLLNALSVTGLIDLLQGEGLGFSQAAGEITWSGDTLTLADVRTSGGALGLTADGPIDLAGNSLALSGTIVPVYGINRILGLVPVLGDLLSGGKGQGIFAATYRLSGSLARPDVSVNPLAVLAPGFLRNLFFQD